MKAPLAIIALAIVGAGLSLLSVERALAHIPALLRVGLGAGAAVFPIYAAARAYKGLADVQLSARARQLVAIALLLAGHGGILLAAARSAKQSPIELLLP
jgi:hypothetical protein